MPKKIFKIDQFHGGLSTNSDPRDIVDNELSEATDIMVDELGKIRLIGGYSTHTSDTPENDQATGWETDTNAIIPGYGLFYFSHDRTGGENKSNFSGEHDAANHDTRMTDSGEAFVADALIGGIIYNDTDGSSGVITDNGTTTVDVAALTGGSDNSWDNTGDDDYHISMPETGDDYLCLYNDNDGQIWIYSRIRDYWDDDYAAANTGVIDIGSSTGAKLVFYIVDGVLRVSDGNFGVNNTNKWYGYIKRSHLPRLPFSAGTADSYDGWFAKDQEIAAPTRGIRGQTDLWTAGTTTDGDNDTLTDTGAFADYDYTNLNGNITSTDIDAKGYLVVNIAEAVYATINTLANDNSVETTTTINVGGSADVNDWHPGSGKTWIMFPAVGTGFNLSASAVNASSSETSPGFGKYEFGSTFIYDGNQESLIYLMPGPYLSIGSDEIGSYSVRVSGPYNPRISGGRIYYRIADTNDDWKLAIDIDLEKGTRTDLSSTYIGFSDQDTDGSTPVTLANSGMLTSIGMRQGDPNLALTYELLTGVSQEETSIAAQYKTAVVANRMVYVGNVKIGGIVLGDAMIKSPVNKPDVFPPGRIIEASVRDGDEIVKLEEYADRILQFKKHKMHLINISQEIEFLEDTFIHKGVKNPYAVCKTDFGIAWINHLGCYLYDGKNVINLLEKQGRQIIKESDWTTFAANDPMIGYIPKKRQLIIVDDNTTTGTGDAFLYDLVTQSWIKGADYTFHSNTLSNFAVDWNGDLTVCAVAGSMVKWDDASGPNASRRLSFMTKDMDFGFPAVRKKIYKVYITFKGNATHAQVHYGVDGLAPALTFNNITSGTDGSSTGSGSSAKCIAYDAGTTDWLKAELKPSASINNVSSFRLKLSGDGSNDIADDFQINDISIVYRLKNIK
jgi:hypothetical protein